MSLINVPIYLTLYLEKDSWATFQLNFPFLLFAVLVVMFLASKFFSVVFTFPSFHKIFEYLFKF